MHFHDGQELVQVYITCVACCRLDPQSKMMGGMCLQVYREANARQVLGTLEGLWDAVGMEPGHTDREAFARLLSGPSRLHAAVSQKVGTGGWLCGRCQRGGWLCMYSSCSMLIPSQHCHCAGPS